MSKLRVKVKATVVVRESLGFAFPFSACTLPLVLLLHSFLCCLCRAVALPSAAPAPSFNFQSVRILFKCFVSFLVVFSAAYGLVPRHSLRQHQNINFYEICYSSAYSPTHTSHNFFLKKYLHMLHTGTHSMY